MWHQRYHSVPQQAQVQNSKRKKVVVDGGFPPNPKSKTEMEMLALPRQGLGGKDFRNFKSRVRCRHETFNGKLKKYTCLAQLFRHGMDKHGEAFRAICVTVQYEMDNGSPIFDAVHHDAGGKQGRSTKRTSRSRPSSRSSGSSGGQKRPTKKTKKPI